MKKTNTSKREEHQKEATN